ncbi:hypothetical protein GCM10025873_23010 [Demequina sediminis]|uniref:hypothetical protein n=1 Tax=Demequina sediminis TaxID=1930058 RepID=UPI0025740545|nr:hypothetical protein [Demequina sediminis]BDZ62510.1 hypothetical protein GCM10025873_23010 [Demequina sediminis]
MTAEIRRIHPALLQMRAADSNPICWGWRYPNADGVVVAWHSWCLASYLENQGGWRGSNRALVGAHESWIASGGSAARSGWQNAEQERMGALWIAMYDAGAFPSPSVYRMTSRRW